VAGDAGRVFLRDFFGRAAVAGGGKTEAERGCVDGVGRLLGRRRRAFGGFGAFGCRGGLGGSSAVLVMIGPP
jgi:hypothetical protein